VIGLNLSKFTAHTGLAPNPKLILHAVKGKAVAMCDLKRASNWAKPILMAALNASKKE